MNCIKSSLEHFQILPVGKANERLWRRNQCLESLWLLEPELLALRPWEWEQDGSGEQVCILGGKHGHQFAYRQTLFSWTLKSLQMVNGDCGHEIKIRLLLGRKAMINLDSVLKSRDITLPTKTCLVKAMVFPVVVYGYKSWIIKKAECRRIDAFEL